MLEANDYRNAVALINRANVQGREMEEVSVLKRRLLEHANNLDRMDGVTVGTPHPPTLEEVRDMERG